jgi:hypothetical protein
MGFANDLRTILYAKLTELGVCPSFKSKVSMKFLLKKGD